jgi:hypothetical protein
VWQQVFDMTTPPEAESRREKFERHAHECLDLVTHSTDPKIRATFAAMAKAWLMLAEEIKAENCN